MLGVYKFLREARAIESPSVLYEIQRPWRIEEETPTFLLSPWKTHILSSIIQNIGFPLQVTSTAKINHKLLAKVESQFEEILETK